jgi:hypothetical protein
MIDIARGIGESTAPEELQRVGGDRVLQIL